MKLNKLYNIQSKIVSTFPFSHAHFSQLHSQISRRLLHRRFARDVNRYRDKCVDSFLSLLLLETFEEVLSYEMDRVEGIER